MVTIEKCNIDIMFINTRPVSAILCKGMQQRETKLLKCNHAWFKNIF